MNHPANTAALPPDAAEAGRIVYIRAVPQAELPPEAQSVAGPVYAIHDADGNRIALVADRVLAFALARQNAMTPVSAH